MKQSKDYTLLLLGIILAIAVLASSCKSTSNTQQHQCLDPKHYTCDGMCDCDGMECYGHWELDKDSVMRYYTTPVNNAVQYIPSRDYQIELIEDSILIFDGHRYVGTLPINWDKPTALDSLFVADNE